MLLSHPEIYVKNLNILLSWETNPGYVPPILFSENQVTLCTKYRQESSLVNFPHKIISSPAGSYDIYEFVDQSQEVQNKDFDLVIVWSSATEMNMPYNTKAFGCPTVLL
ncbi:MAG: hypothetical protein Q6M54_06975, partial [Thermostichus sp. DRC_bins_24]